MTANLELSGVTIVGAGAFNPAIFHPAWFRENGLLASSDVEAALDPGLEQLVVSPQLSAFKAGWVAAQVTEGQMVLSTVDEARELELRDLAKNVFELLPHTPVDALGVNSDSHFRVESEEAWHEVGDTFLPKDRWDPLFAVEGQEWFTREGGKVTGMRSMTVESWRPNRRDFVRVEVAPSVRIGPYGVYVGINAHFQLSFDGNRGDGGRAAVALAENWEGTRAFEEKLRDGILAWVA